MSILDYWTVRSPLDTEKLRIFDNANMFNTKEWGVGISSLTELVPSSHVPVHVLVLQGVSGAQYCGQSSSPQLCRSSTSACCCVGLERHCLTPLSQAAHLQLPPSPSRSTAKLAESVLVLQHQVPAALSCRFPHLFPHPGNTTQGNCNWIWITY